MPVAIHNYDFTYTRKGKPVFVPSRTGRRIGEEIKASVDSAFRFPDMYFHMSAGGHVSAMHHHRDSEFFARIDISRFFYSVSRRRVQSALGRIGIKEQRFYAQWSTVRNPYREPAYSLPYGFVQSPILASLVVATSDVGDYLSRLPGEVKVSVYMDDIALSGGDLAQLQNVFEKTIEVLLADGYLINEDKMRRPSPAMDIFNCDLSKGRSSVRDERIEEFIAENPSEASVEAFVAYCASVERGNTV